MIAAGAMVAQDVPPYCMVHGDRAALVGLNTEGLRRRGFTPDAIRAIRRAYRVLFRGGTPLPEAVSRARKELGHVAEVNRLIEFVAGSKRGVCRPRVRSAADDDGEE
jgi:UDP-N-acetylglucosamine acyltransferase